MGTTSRTADDHKRKRNNSLNGVKDEVIEVRDQIHDLIAKPIFLEDNIIPEDVVVIESIEAAKPIVPTVQKAEVLITEYSKPKIDNINNKQALEKPVIAQSLTLLPVKERQTNDGTDKVVVETKHKPIYKKHDIDGVLLDHDTEQWTCIHDTQNGLMWEVKSNNDDMRNSNNLYSWFKERAEENWQGPFRINDIDKSVEECLSSITVSNEGHIYSTWIDTRTSETSDVIMSSTSEEHPEEKNKGMKKPKAKIYVSVSMDNGKTWSKSDLVYKSPDGSVCECCKPSIESDKNGNLIIMFRNNIDGSRDLHYTMSKDKGKSFSPPQKLGSGTWKINGCPMDGGGFTSLGNDEIISAWQREGMVYTATSDLSEQLIGAGRAPSISGNRDNYSLVYTKGDEVMAVHEPMIMFEKIGNGSSAKVLATEDDIIYMWLSEKGIEYKKFKRI